MPSARFLIEQPQAEDTLSAKESWNERDAAETPRATGSLSRQAVVPRTARGSACLKRVKKWYRSTRCRCSPSSRAWPGTRPWPCSASSSCRPTPGRARCRRSGRPWWPRIKPEVALPFCLGNFPQMVRHLPGLLHASDAALRAPAGATTASPELLAWAERTANSSAYPQALLAIAMLRLARQHDAAGRLSPQLKGQPPEWRGTIANEEAALAWHRGDLPAAAASWRVPARQCPGPLQPRPGGALPRRTSPGPFLPGPGGGTAPRRRGLASPGAALPGPGRDARLSLRRVNGISGSRTRQSAGNPRSGERGYPKI